MPNPLRNFVKQAPGKPDDFDSVEEFLSHVRELFIRDIEADRRNREEASKDLAFAAGEQWDQRVIEARRRAGKPILTFNRIPTFVSNVIANRILTDVTIKVLPEDESNQDKAKIRQGIIRNIMKNSEADRAFIEAFKNQVICGIGHFQISLDFADDDVFEQDINIIPIPDPLSVVWDSESVDLTGADADHVFVIDALDKDEFHRRYPDAVVGDFGLDSHFFDRSTRDRGDVVHVVSFWRMRSETRELALVENEDGSTSVIDITDEKDDSDILARVVVDRDGRPVIRESKRRKAEMWLLTSQSILAGPYVLPITRVPVFKQIGWEVFTDEGRMRWGLVRFLRDPQKLHNFWRSVVAEKLMKAPRNVWLAPIEAVKGYEDIYRRSHISDDPLLVYNSDAGVPPQLVNPPDIQNALLTEASQSAQDLRDISGISEAALGLTSNEVSGQGILARQRVGELGMVIYNKNADEAIQEAGKVVNELIPIVYDTIRTVKILGEESDSIQFITINRTLEDDITIGKYSVVSSTGPSFTTKRVEAAEAMFNMINAMPQTLGVAADLIIDAQDWPGKEKIVRRLRMQLPPGFVDPDELPPEVIQQQAAQQQAAQQQAQIQLAQVAAELREKEARAREAEARALASEAEAAKTLSEVGVRRFSAETKALEGQRQEDRRDVETVNDILMKRIELLIKLMEEPNG